MLLPSLRMTEGAKEATNAADDKRREKATDAAATFEGAKYRLQSRPLKVLGQTAAAASAVAQNASLAAD